MCHVQQKKLTALHLKPKKLRRDIRAVVDSGFTRKTWLDIGYITGRKGRAWAYEWRESLKSNIYSRIVKGLWGWVILDVGGI